MGLVFVVLSLVPPPRSRRYDLVRLTKARRKQARKQDGCQTGYRVEGAPRAPPVFRTAVKASGEFLGQPTDDARRASHVAEPVFVVVPDGPANEFGAVGAEAGHGVVDVLVYVVTS